MSFLCSTCRRQPRRDGQRTCADCHAANERARRAERKAEFTRLRSIEDKLLELLAEGRKGPKRAEPTRQEERKHA
jgi:RimJ/RimL family protein N-acetyltransferase